MSDEAPMRLVLTPEQTEVIRRLSGQHVQAIELQADKTAGQAGGALKFVWRLSAATGIPRQAWVEEEASAPPSPKPQP
jgi:hypothetical protein